jgi:hypothetical protein
VVLLAWDEHQQEAIRGALPASSFTLLRSEGLVMTVTPVRAPKGKLGAQASGRRPARAGTVEHLSRADRVARGKDARAATPLESHAEFRPGASRDPVGLLLAQAASRVPELVPVSAVRKSIAQVDGGGARKLKAALAEAQAGMGG